MVNELLRDENGSRKLSEKCERKNFFVSNFSLGSILDDYEKCKLLVRVVVRVDCWVT